LQDDTPDDGRLYFRVVDPEDCKLHAAPDRKSTILGERSFNDILRGAQLVKNGAWLELHACEEFDDSGGHRKAFVPLFAATDDEDEQEEVIERLRPREYPRRPRWEQLGLSVKPVGLRPPKDTDFPQDYGRWRDPERPPNQKDWPFVYKHGLALATVVRGAPDYVLDSFVRWHWITGWNHIFLYFDDPEDPAIDHAKVLEHFSVTKAIDGIGLSVRKMDSEWWDEAKVTSRFFLRREKNDMYESVCRACEKGNPDVRQLIAFDLAVQEAHRKGMDWFAHVGIDECVYVPKLLDNSARRFLGSRERSVDCVRLWNHEAIPESTQVQDWFRECTLFQVNRQHCQGFKPPREYDSLLRRREGREFEREGPTSETRWWGKLMSTIRAKRQAAVRRLKLDLPPAPPGVSPELDVMAAEQGSNGQEQEAFVYFSADDHGKTVVRLRAEVQPPMPLGLHSFLADSGELLKYEQACAVGDPVVLHYPDASLALWREKYERLGEIPLGQEIQREKPRAHLASSQVVLHRQRHQQELFYRTAIMQNEYSELALLAEHGLVIRIEGVKELLEFYDQPREAPEQLPGRVQLYDLHTGMKFGRA